MNITSILNGMVSSVLCPLSSIASLAGTQYTPTLHYLQTLYPDTRSRELVALLFYCSMPVHIIIMLPTLQMKRQEARSVGMSDDYDTFSSTKLALRLNLALIFVLRC